MVDFKEVYRTKGIGERQLYLWNVRVKSNY